jgi:Cys-tRNA(Pro)/Cys-tRNA(Cys) deacylase
VREEPSKTTAARILDRLGVRYELRAYEVREEELDAVSVAARVGLPPEHVFKTLVLRGDRTGLLMACLPGSATLDLRALAAASGDKRAEMVPVRDLPALTGYVRGGVSPLGARRRCPVFLDASAPGLPQVSVSAGRRGLQIVLAGADLVRATGARLLPLARKPSP